MITDFSKGFTDRQKVTILVVLRYLAAVDGGSNDLEKKKQWAQIGQVLDVDCGNPQIQRLFAETDSIPFSRWMEILNTLNKNQKEWVIISAISMAGTDGEIVQSEQNAIEILCEHLDFSDDELENIIKKMVVLQGMNRKMKSEPVKETKGIDNSGCFGVLLFFITLAVSTFFIAYI